VSNKTVFIFQIIAHCCISWESSSSDQQQGLSRQISSLLARRLCKVKVRHEVLHLLVELSNSHLGLSILSEPQVAEELLTLLTSSSNLPPKTLMICAKLCHISLPRMSKCANVEGVVDLLFKRLADFLVPDGNQVTSVTSQGQPRFERQTSEDLTIFVHLNGNISAQDLIQQVIQSFDQRNMRKLLLSFS